MRALSLFTGYGGIDLALSEYITEIVAYVEIEEYAQKIIAYRMADGSLKRAPILADVKNVEGQIGDCDIIYGGFPCQDLSVAGNGKGLEGERSGLFYEIVRLTKEIRPSFVFLENVPAIRTRGLDQVIKEFTEMGYDCRWTMLSAESVGAPHKRERWFLLARSDSSKLWDTKSGGPRGISSEFGDNGSKESLADSDSLWESPKQENRKYSLDRTSDCGENGVGEKLADSNGERLEGQPRTEGPRGERRFKIGDESFQNRQYWSAMSEIRRVSNGTPFRAHRIKALGNGVVPLQVKIAFERLIGMGHTFL